MSPEGIQNNTPEKIPVPQVEEVRTARGSIYRYLPDGRTQRFKTAEDALKAPQDALVFIPPWNLIGPQTVSLYPKLFSGVENQVQYEQVLLEYAQVHGKTMRIIDKDGNELSTNEQIAAAAELTPNTNNIFIHFIDRSDKTKSFTLPVSPKPKGGYQTFDTRKYEEGGETFRERHIGNAVVDIKYKEQE